MWNKILIYRNTMDFEEIKSAKIIVIVSYEVDSVWINEYFQGLGFFYI